MDEKTLYIITTKIMNLGYLADELNRLIYLYGDNCKVVVDSNHCNHIVGVLSPGDNTDKPVDTSFIVLQTRYYENKVQDKGD